jgi:hypothetical protein
VLGHESGWYGAQVLKTADEDNRTYQQDERQCYIDAYQALPGRERRGRILLGERHAASAEQLYGGSDAEQYCR